MGSPTAPPEFKTYSPTMRVDALISDWRASLAPELSAEERERGLYEQAFAAYLEGDYGFGQWCWFECDRLTNALGGSVREVTRVLGPGKYFGFPQRRAVAERVPLEHVHRPRKGEMSTPRTDAVVLAGYQLLCVYEVRAKAGDAKSKALLEIALGETEERRRADPYMKHYETFRDLLNRAAVASSPPAPSSAPAAESPPMAGPPRKRRSGS
jgi:hypothetical protein